jgi:hypothetical protein
MLPFGINELSHFQAEDPLKGLTDTIGVLNSIRVDGLSRQHQRQHYTHEARHDSDLDF